MPPAPRPATSMEERAPPPPSSPERRAIIGNNKTNTDQDQPQPQPLTPVHSAGCLLDTFALCGVGGGIGTDCTGGGSSSTGPGSAEKTRNKEKNKEKKKKKKKDMSSTNDANTDAHLTSGVAGTSMSLGGSAKEAAATCCVGKANTTSIGNKTAADTSTTTGTSKTRTSECDYWSADRVDFARRCTLQRYDDQDEDDNDDASSSGSGSSTPSKSKPPTAATAPGRSTPSSNTKVKRKSSTLGGLTSSFGSRRSSSSAATTTDTTSTPPKRKELPGQPIPSTSWGYSSATKFSVRSGPNYARNGLKKPSLESLYEVVAVRMFTSGKKTTGGMARTLPAVQDILMLGRGGGGDDNHSDDDGAPKLWSDMSSSDGGGVAIDPAVPDVLIFHVQMPHDAPSMFKAAEDGPGEEAVVYLRPSPRFVSEMTGQTPMTPATKLFVRWCQTADVDLAMRSRFKCMALVRNLEAHNLGWVAPYNGKPVLITESGKCRKGVLEGVGGGGGDVVRYVEMTADVFKWGFLAKKGFVTLLPKFKELRLDIGFTIEGKADDELPECMLGTFVANFCDEGKLEAITAEMQQRPV